MWVTPRFEGPHSASGGAWSKSKPSSSPETEVVVVVGVVVALAHWTKYVTASASALMTEAKRDREGSTEGM